MTRRDGLGGRPGAWLRAVGRRWPVVLGLGVFGLMATGADPEAPFSVLMIATAAYLATAVTGDPRASWPTLGAGVVLMAGSSVLGVDSRWAGPVLVLATLVRAFVTRRRGQDRTRQWAVFAAAGTLAAIAVLTGPAAGLVLAGAGLLAHSAWDVWHLARRRTVAPSMAEFCVALDLPLGLALLAAPILT